MKRRSYPFALLSALLVSLVVIGLSGINWNDSASAIIIVGCVVGGTLLVFLAGTALHNGLAAAKEKGSFASAPDAAQTKKTKSPAVKKHRANSTAKKTSPKKKALKKPAPRKTAAKKATTKKSVAKNAAMKKGAAKNPGAPRGAAKKSAAPRGAARKSVVKKTAVKPSAAGKASTPSSRNTAPAVGRRTPTRRRGQ